MNNTKKTDNIHLIVEIAKLYYESNLTQAQIAESLGLTRLRVIELLKKAKAEGVVRIKIINPAEDFIPLEKSVAEKYGLKKVIVVPSNGDDATMLLSHLGKAASAFLNETLEHDDVLGIGWGMTIYETAKQLKYYGNKRVVSVPLIGGGNETQIQYGVNDLTKKFAASFGGESFALFAPALVDNKDIRDAIVSDSKIKQIYDFWKRLDVVLIGIGTMKKEFPDVFQAIYKTQPVNFRELGIVGDILSRYYDIDGQPIVLDVHERILGIDLEAIKNTEMVVGVAGGVAKYNAILGAIRGGIVKVLITDENVALKLDRE